MYNMSYKSVVKQTVNKYVNTKDQREGGRDEHGLRRSCDFTFNFLSQMVSSLQVLRPAFCMHFLFVPCVLYYVLRPSHLLCFNNPNNIWWRVQIMKVLIMQFSPAVSNILPVRSKYEGW
jgi:hypothetical protein